MGAAPKRWVVHKRLRVFLNLFNLSKLPCLSPFNWMSTTALFWSWWLGCKQRGGICLEGGTSSVCPFLRATEDIKHHQQA